MIPNPVIINGFYVFRLCKIQNYKTVLSYIVLDESGSKSYFNGYEEVKFFCNN